MITLIKCLVRLCFQRKTDYFRIIRIFSESKTDRKSPVFPEKVSKTLFRKNDRDILRAHGMEHGRQKPDPDPEVVPIFVLKVSIIKLDFKKRTKRTDPVSEYIDHE